MEKVQDFISKVPNLLVDIINKQTYVREFDNYLAKVEDDIKYFKKCGTFKAPSPSLSNGSDNVNTKQLLCESQTRQAVLSENSSAISAQIKLERISTVPLNYPAAEAGNRESLKENIKIENFDMPPPQFPIKKNRKIKEEKSTRSTRSKASKKTNTPTDSGQGRESDVVLQKQTVELIVLTDSDDESKNSNKKVSARLRVNSDENYTDPEQTTRVTRTKTRKKNQDNSEENNKRTRSPSTDIEQNTKLAQAKRQVKHKRSKESPSKEVSVYEDAEDNKAVNNLDQTHTIEKGTPKEVAISDRTVTVTTPKVVQNIPVAPINIRDIMTDDEDNITTTLPQKTKKTIKKGAKPIFSPFESSPVKKRVEAFEKLGAETASEIPIRMPKTRSKLNGEKEDNKAPGTPLLQSIRDKVKNITPQMANRYLAATSKSACMATRTKFINESLISSKCASALKASQQEFIYRENRRREKEAEAIKKRDELIQAQIEEKKKKRLEKQVKAQQMREALEKTKLKSLEEAERIKEEKHKQALAEKQEKMKKQQEEAERRRLEVLKKAMEEKRKAAQEEQANLKELDLKKAAIYKKKVKQLPLYLRLKAPLLPTEDCFDSDDEASQRQIRKPRWASKENMEVQLRSMEFIYKDFVRRMFVLDITPDLRDIFEYIDPRKLKRTSSAVWKVPPRFTLMPESIEECDDD